MDQQTGLFEVYRGEEPTVEYVLFENAHMLTYCRKYRRYTRTEWPSIQELDDGPNREMLAQGQWPSSQQFETSSNLNVRIQRCSNRFSREDVL